MRSWLASWVIVWVTAGRRFRSILCRFLYVSFFVCRNGYGVLFCRDRARVGVGVGCREVEGSLFGGRVRKFYFYEGEFDGRDFRKGREGIGIVVYG